MRVTLAGASTLYKSPQANRKWHNTTHARAPKQKVRPILSWADLKESEAELPGENIGRIFVLLGHVEWSTDSYVDGFTLLIECRTKFP